MLKRKERRKGGKTYSLDNNPSNLVRAPITSRTAILKVPLPILGNLPRDPNTAPTISNAVAELLNVPRLMTTRETLVISFAVHGDVLGMAGGELLHGVLDDFEAAVGTGGVEGDVGVEAGSVPVALDGFGFEGDLDAEFFGYAVQDEAGHPELVAHYQGSTFFPKEKKKKKKKKEKPTLNSIARTNLKLPLRRHNLGIDTGDLDARIQTGAIMSLHDIATVDFPRPDTAVVRTLSPRVPILGPSVGPIIHAQQRVFLLETEPEILAGVGFHQTVGVVAVVELVGGTVGIVGLAEDEDVVPSAEGVRVDGDGAEVDVRVVAACLAGGGAVEVPFREVLGA